MDSAAWVFGEGPDALAVPIFVPSGAQSGLKINIEPPLEIAIDGDHVLTVVFDVAKAIVKTPPGSGNFILKPTAVCTQRDPRRSRQRLNRQTAGGPLGTSRG